MCDVFLPGVAGDGLEGELAKGFVDLADVLGVGFFHDFFADGGSVHLAEGVRDVFVDGGGDEALAGDEACCGVAYW